MWSSSQMDDIELRTAIFPEFDGLHPERRWYFVGELQYGSTMSKNYLINDEINCQEVTFVEGDLSKN